MENTNTFWNVVLRWGTLNGLVISATGIIGMLVVKDPEAMLNNTSTQNMIQSICLLGFGIYCYYMVIKDYQSATEMDTLSFNMGAKLVFAKALVAGIIYFVVYYLYITFIDTSMIDFIQTQMEEEFIEQGLEDEDLEQALNMSSMFASPFFIAFSGTMLYKFFGALFLGLPIVYFATKNEQA